MMNLTPQEFRAQLSRMVDDPALVEATVAQYRMKWEAKPFASAPRKVKVVTEPAKSEAELYEEEMARASDALLEAMKAEQAGRPVKAPRELRWRTRSGLDTSNGNGGNFWLYSPEPEPERTFRDPCPRCGARGDYDCGHAPVHGGRLLSL
jgi:hypothetical protein